MFSLGGCNYLAPTGNRQHKGGMVWSYTHPAMHLLAALQRRKLGISGAVTMGEGGDVEEKISFQAWTTQIELISFLNFFLNVSFSFFFSF